MNHQKHDTHLYLLKKMGGGNSFNSFLGRSYCGVPRCLHHEGRSW